MKGKFFVLLVSICLLSSSAYAQGLVPKGLRAISKTKVPSPSLITRATAWSRGQLPALKRLQRIRFHSSSVKSWRKQNPALAKRLDEKGFLLERAPLGRTYTHTISFDGVNLYEADETLVKAVESGRPIQVGGNGELKVFLYKDGPSFNFYDEELFKELDRSKSLGFTMLEKQGYVTMLFPEEFGNTRILKDSGEHSLATRLKELNPYEVTRYTHSGFVWDHPLFTPWENNSGMVEGFSISKTEGGFVGSYRADAKSVEGLNNWYEGFKKAAEKIKPYEGRFNMSVVYRVEGTEAKFWIQDSRGTLYKPEDIEAAVAAEREALLLPVIQIQPPTKLEGNFGEFEEVL